MIVKKITFVAVILFIFIVVALVLRFEFNVNGNATKHISLKCTDNDGGINYYKKGVINYKGKIYTDSCRKNYLTEWYCNSIKTTPKSKRYPCKNGCNQGACVYLNTITVEGRYSGIYKFPESFFDGSEVSPTEFVKITDIIYLLEVELSNGKLVYNSFIKGEYSLNIYGSTTSEGFVLGDVAAPKNNFGHHSWDVIAHEVGHCVDYFTRRCGHPLLSRLRKFNAEEFANAIAAYLYSKEMFLSVAQRRRWLRTDLEFLNRVDFLATYQIKNSVE